METLDLPGQAGAFAGFGRPILAFSADLHGRPIDLRRFDSDFARFLGYSTKK
jgi:hypothetical protein